MSTRLVKHFKVLLSVFGFEECPIQFIEQEFDSSRFPVPVVFTKLNCVDNMICMNYYLIWFCNDVAYLQDHYPRLQFNYVSILMILGG